VTAVTVLAGADGPAAGSNRAIAPVAPVLPAGVVAAMQEGKYAEAIAGIDGLTAAAKEPSERAYHALIRGTAHRISGKSAEARATWTAALKADEKGPWAAKLRYELASLELAEGRPAEAEGLARVEAERLLAGERKDRLAGVYYAFARRLLKPDDPITPADPKGAYDLLKQALALAKGADLARTIRLEMARAAAASGNHAQAVADFQEYLKDPKAPERAEAQYGLGESQFHLNQYPAARATWTDLASDLDRAPGRDRPNAAEIRAKALYQIARTYHVPSPPDSAQLQLGVAALRRFLAAYPAHAWAVRASYEIGASYLARGESDQALAALKDFLAGKDYRAETDEAKRDLASLSMTATYQTAQILQGQQKFDDAIAAWQGYLAKFPNGPQSADAQRAILDTKLLIASEAIRREKYDDARAAWSAFVAQNPLDARVPQILFQIGESYVPQEKFDDAIAAWETLNSKFPGSEPAAHGQFLIASIFENQKGNPAEAIERFKKVTVDPWKSSAAQRIAVMESRELTVVTPRTFRSGETPNLKVTTRNLENLTFSAYKLNPEAYFRKKQVVGSVETLDIGLVAPDAEWTVPVPQYAKYKPVESSYDLKVKAPGVWVVKVSDEKHLRATTLVVGSDVDATIKASRDQLLVFAQDMKTGKGRAKARVLVSDGSGVFLEKTTGDDGVLLTAWDKPRDPNAGLHYLVVDGADVASNGLTIPGQVAQGLTARAYIYTDRPAYRPGHEVAIRGIVREAREGQYASPSGETYRFEVLDSRGRLLVARQVKLSEFGTFHEQVGLDTSAPVGSYRVRLFQPGKSEFAGSFEVQSYRLEKVDISIDLPKTVYFRGETIAADVVAKYQYGAPLANKLVEVAFSGGIRKVGRTDGAGKFHVEFPTTELAEEQTLGITARLMEENVAASASVALAIRALQIGLSTTRDTYLDGESFALKLHASDPLGKPVGQGLTLAVIKRIVQKSGEVSERQVSEQTVTTDAKTGEASAQVKVDDPDGGPYVLRVSGKDRFGNVVVADRVLTISGAKDETKLRLLADRLSYKVGETAKVNLHSRVPAGPALIAWEADRIIQYRISDLKEGENPLEWAVEGPQFPNFTLTAARMSSGRFDEARLDIRVERDLRVTVAPKRPTAGPNEEVEVEITTADQLGRPVAAEVSLALVDLSLLRLFDDGQTPIGPYFYNQTRTGAFATIATNLFKYEPATEPIEEAVVEEAERLKAIADNEKLAPEARQQAQAALNSMFQYSFMARSVKDASAPANIPRELGRVQSGAPEAAPMMAPAPTAPATAEGLGLQVDAANAGIAGRQYKALSTRGHSLAREMKEEDAKLGDPAEAKAAKPAGRAGGLGMLGALAEKRRARYGESQEEAARDKAGEPGRERFVETAYWNPAIVTGADGKASVKFKAPGAMSEYRFTARGVTGADTLVGQTEATLVVRKDFFVDLKAPSALAQGDRPRFIGQIHHVGVAGDATLTLTVYAGGKQDVFPKTLTLKGDGVEEVVFDPILVPDGDTVRLTLKAQVGERSDELTGEVPIRPWGVQAFASASGTTSDDATVFVGLPSGRSYENPDMLITIAPSLRRMIVELALDGIGPIPLARYDRGMYAPCPILPLTIADRASELIAASAALHYLRAIKADQAPEAQRLSARIQGLTSELITLQNDDGGWPWVAPAAGGKSPSDRMTSALAARAFAAAWSQAMMTDSAAFDRAAHYLAQEWGKVPAADLEMRAMVQHALAAMRRGSFEQANALNRSRQSLPDAALAELALALAALDRASLAGELLDILSTRAKTEPVEPGAKRRVYWEGNGQRWHRGRAETTALAALAYARVRPQAPELAGAIEWLLAHRTGNGWQPPKAKGPAVEALAVYYGKAESAEDRYRLVVAVNDTEVYNAEVHGAADGKGILVPRKALKLGDRNRVRFHVEGRATLGYAVSLTGFARDFGPEQARNGKPFTVDRRDDLAPEPELDGKTLPAGFGSVVNPQPFVNKVTQVGLGGRARVEIGTSLHRYPNVPDWDRDFLVIEETLPAGTSMVEGSLRSNAVNSTLVDGVLTLYFAPGTYPGTIGYDVFGYLPGEYRAAPTRIRSAYDPGTQHLGPAGMLRVLNPGETPNDPYKATPDELLARGKALFESGRLHEAALPLEELFGGYTPKDEVARDAARMLLTIHVKDYQPRKVVQDFEVLKEKAPDLVIPFDEVLVVGRAYRDIGEHERAYLVWRAIVEASYLEDAQVGEVLRRRGKTLDAVAYLLDLWRDYPNTASIEADLFGLSQLLAVSAGKAFTDPALRKELADAGVTRSELILQAVRLGQVFLVESPKNPMADEVSLALVGNFLELENYEAVVRLAARFAGLYPKSTFLDSFQYSEALGEFHLGHYDRAIEVAEKITKATYKDANGVDQPSPNKWQATYILGQIYDARRQPAKAVEYYKLVADRFSDAAGAVKGLTRKDLKVPEISLVRPGAKVAAASPALPGGLALSRVAAEPPVTDKPSIALDYRNIPEADVKVYPVDLMRLYLTRRNLDEIAGIDLAGITPLVETTVKLGDGQDFEDKVKTIDLPVEKEGAYLVMIRGENLYASGIVLVSPLEMDVLEEADAGRVRVRVRDAKTKAPVAKVNVKVIGTDNPTFLSGQTDLRGVYVAEGVRGQVTAVARRESAQYAFYRGTTHVGPPPAPARAAEPANRPPAPNAWGDINGDADLGKNIKMQNFGNSMRQIQRLENRYNANPQGVNPGGMPLPAPVPQP
jgi:uncharacterized protein YfaS (alpha-2-macroglobulin family)/TolA-binding protein